MNKTNIFARQLGAFEGLKFCDKAIDAAFEEGVIDHDAARRLRELVQEQYSGATWDNQRRMKWALDVAFDLKPSPNIDQPTEVLMNLLDGKLDLV